MRIKLAKCCKTCNCSESSSFCNPNYIICKKLYQLCIRAAVCDQYEEMPNNLTSFLYNNDNIKISVNQEVLYDKKVDSNKVDSNKVDSNKFDYGVKLSGFLFQKEEAGMILREEATSNYNLANNISNAPMDIIPHIRRNSFLITQEDYERAGLNPENIRT